MLVLLWCLCGCEETKETIVLNDLIKDQWDIIIPKLRDSVRVAQIALDTLVRPVNRIMNNIQAQIDTLTNSESFTDAYNERQKKISEIRSRWVADQHLEQIADTDMYKQLQYSEMDDDDSRETLFVVRAINIDGLLKRLSRCSLTLPAKAYEQKAESPEKGGIIRFFRENAEI